MPLVTSDGFISPSGPNTGWQFLMPQRDPGLQVRGPSSPTATLSIPLTALYTLLIRCSQELCILGKALFISSCRSQLTWLPL